MGLIAAFCPSFHLVVWACTLGFLLALSSKSWELEFSHEFLGSTWDGVGSSLLSFHYWLMLVVVISGWRYSLSSCGLGQHFILCLWGLTVCVQMALSANSFFYLFVFFEASLFPVGVMILLWGNQPERTKAFEFMLVYALCSGVPFFVGVTYVSNISLGWFYGVKEVMAWSSWVLMGMMLGGMAKLPIYGFHVWLPKAHVEASLEGSLILAGILLKLGGLQIYRLLTELSASFSSPLSYILLLCLWGGVYANLVCFRQADVKSVIAYSSVGHMSVVLSGLLFNDFLSAGVALSMMVGHGFISCGMFTLAAYGSKLSGSRSFYVLKGMASVYPVLSVFWFVGCIFNMGLPPSLGFAAEVGALGQLWARGFSGLVACLVGVFLSAAYNFFVFSETQHGSSFSGSKFLSVVSVREYLSLGLCLLPGTLSFLFLPFFFCF
uniref:NADH-ubiquinone oxidoreductase chain 4 n=1 Tax=Pinctada albina TaxID=315487 RepID=A0A1S5UZM5_9BIVA|nr:NADH dehydrogenase subunit 4 [Pinctada albina]